jgi:hypothetical protein
MELLKRSLLVGCLLAGLWLLWLAPLDAVLTITPVDFSLQQKQEAASVPDAQKTEAQRRRADIPLSVYIEEFLQYNVFSATGAEWERLLAGVDGQPARGTFVRPDRPPVDALADKLATGGGTTYVSLSRPGGDVHYRVVRHRWTRHDFQLGRGFLGSPSPPASILYPFRRVGLASLLAGVLFFVLLPSSARGTVRVGTRELAALAIAVVSFATPLFLVGGSAQALARAPAVTVVCWILTAAAVHVFAAPPQTAPDPLLPAGASPGRRVPLNLLFVREGLAFLLVALGPLALLVWATMVLWNR